MLDTRVRSCAALVTVIGPRWPASSDDNSRRRIDDENDYVRHELAVALKEKIRIIPVLVGRAQMPRSTDLPADISDLARRNAVEITDAAFQAGATRISKLDAILSPLPPHPDRCLCPCGSSSRDSTISDITGPSAVRQHQDLALASLFQRSELDLDGIGVSRSSWRSAQECWRSVWRADRSLDKRAATAAGVAPEPQTVTTRLLGSVVPVPNAGRPLKVVVDGERGEGVTNELGRFAFPVKGRDGDTVRLKIYADGTLLYDDYAMLPGPLTISLRR